MGFTNSIDKDPQAKPSLTSLASNARTMLLGKGAPLLPEDDAEMTKTPNSSSSAGKLSSDPGNVSREAVGCSPDQQRLIGG